MDQTRSTPVEDRVGRAGLGDIGESDIDAPLEAQGISNRPGDGAESTADPAGDNEDRPVEEVSDEGVDADEDEDEDDLEDEDEVSDPEAEPGKPI